MDIFTVVEVDIEVLWVLIPCSLAVGFTVVEDHTGPI